MLSVGMGVPAVPGKHKKGNITAKKVEALHVHVHGDAGDKTYLNPAKGVPPPLTSPPPATTAVVAAVRKQEADLERRDSLQNAKL